jgi:hypothetical protein
MVSLNKKALYIYQFVTGDEYRPDDAAACTSETSVKCHQTIWPNNPRDIYLDVYNIMKSK